MTLLCRSVLFGPVKGVYSYDPIIPWDATRTLCLLGGGGGGGGGGGFTFNII